MKKKRNWLPWVLGAALVCMAALAAAGWLRSPAADEQPEQQSGLFYEDGGFRWYVSIDGITDQPEGVHILPGNGRKLNLDVKIGYSDEYRLPSKTPTTYLNADISPLPASGIPDKSERIYNRIVASDFYDERYLCDGTSPLEPESLCLEIPYHDPQRDLVFNLIIFIASRSDEESLGEGYNTCYVIVKRDGTLVLCDYAYLVQQGYREN